jgi:predicted enzyme related to lactoylglutathione lyase/ketosteroid isomerase-like protein
MPPGKDFTRGQQQREKVLDEAAKAMSGWQVIEYKENFEELEIFGDTAIEWGTMSGAMRAKSPPGAVVTTAYKVMRVLKRQPDGSWKIHRTIWNDGPGKSNGIANAAASKEKLSVANPVLQFQMLSSDPEATAKFYTALFDWSANAKDAMGCRCLHTRSEEGIQGGIWPAPPGAPAFVQLFVGVPDLKAALERAAALGAKVLVPPTPLPEGGNVAILQDPQGMSFGLWQRG